MRPALLNEKLDRLVISSKIHDTNKHHSATTAAE